MELRLCCTNLSNYIWKFGNFFPGVNESYYCGLVMQYDNMYLGQYWFRVIALWYKASSHYLNQCWLVAKEYIWFEWKWTGSEIQDAIKHYVFNMIIVFGPEWVNSLWPCDVILLWQQWSQISLLRVMACCLTAPSHNLKQCLNESNDKILPGSLLQPVSRPPPLHLLQP